MTCNFCPICRSPVSGPQYRERKIDRLADRLRLAYIKRLGGEPAYFTATPWDALDDTVKDTWRDSALTAIAALDIP